MPPEAPVVCVDLDGTLVSADLFWESVLALVKQRPWTVLLFPVWMSRGRAYAKRQVALRVGLDPATLPYRPEVLAFLHDRRGGGTRVVLATACDEIQARSIAAYLGLFEDVHASDGTINLSGRRKADRLIGVYGAGGFDYLGNGRVDIPLWHAAGRAILVDAPPGVERLVRTSVPSVNVLVARTVPLTTAIVRALRPWHWVKNLVVFAPLAAAHALADLERLPRTAAAFAVFCLAASAVYACNDLLDIRLDRVDARKRHRPFASGILSIPLGVSIGTVLAVSALAVAALTTSGTVVAAVALFLALGGTYSLWLKRFTGIDVAVLAGLYLLRLAAGGAAAGIALSPWLMAFATFAFLSLVMLMRFPAVAMAGSAEGRARAGDREWMIIGGMASAFSAAAILAVYATSPAAAARYSAPARLWLLCPIALAWFGRYWLRAARATVSSDLVREALTDPATYVLAALATAVLLSAI